jgi:hypothetical protein
MNTSHYPSLELCKRLTEAGFPETEIMRDSINPYRIWWQDVCPSIAELLDSLREDRRRVAHRQYSELKDDTSFPDYLAEFYLFDKENNYLPK